MAFKNKKKQKFRNFGAFEKLDKLEEANFLLEGGQLREALRFLEETIQKYPNEVRFWEMLAFVGNELKDVSVMQKSFAELIRFQPNDADARFGLAYAYGLDNRLALSYRGFREFLERFPGDEKSKEASEMLEIAEKDLRRNLDGFGFPEGDEGLELACLHEEAQILMNRGEFEPAKEKAEKLIGEMPDFVPAYNNLSLILFTDGEALKAFESAQKVLAKQPENFHALANLVRFAIFLGKPDEARNFANRLRLVESDNSDVWIKKIEAFTFAGDDDSVVEVFKEAKNKKGDFAAPENFGKHLAAFAFYRLEKENQARKLWREILEDEPDFEFAQRNLEELNLPKNERNVFALPVNYWIPARYINDLMAETGKIKDGRNFEKNLQKKVAGFFEKNPNILGVLSVLLERGDEAAREFAVKLMDWAGTPESYRVLKDFAFSQNGSDKMRYKAAMTLAQADVISNKVRLWNDGEWREMMLMVFEITGEPMDAYPMKPKAQQMLAKGLETMQKQNLDLAGQYFKMAVEINGDHPSILYNLLTIKQMKGKRADAEDELKELVRRFPDYSFAAISLATFEVKKGNVEAAKKLVERFYDKKKWHFSEIKIWFYFNLEMALEEKHFESARMSLDMLKNFDENLDYEYWDDLILRMALLDKISGIPNKLAGKRKKKK